FFELELSISSESFCELLEFYVISDVLESSAAAELPLSSQEQNKEAKTKSEILVRCFIGLSPLKSY
ncbi:MAG: hypothetical protein SOZ02_03595, partial [Hallerella porci]|uniref:hypothetical protein n=1 Tax=Hallerella porci TaxID=1945871 RepID=UPI002A81569C